MALNFFSRPVTEAGFSPEYQGSDSPVYQAARRTNNERYSIHAEEAKRWRWIALGCLTITALAVAGLAQLFH